MVSAPVRSGAPESVVTEDQVRAVRARGYHERNRARGTFRSRDGDRFDAEDRGGVIADMHT